MRAGFHWRTGPILGTYHVQESEERFSKKPSVLRPWLSWKERLPSNQIVKLTRLSRQIQRYSVELEPTAVMWIACCWTV
jgi:hypothetical protein